MLFSKKRKNVSYSDLRSRLEEYSNARERDNKWFFEEGEKDNTAFFESFPLSFVRNMHSYLLFKITLVVLTVVVVFFLSLVKMPFSASVMEKINYITTWKMDFVEIGRVALPVIRGLWEGDLESGLNTPVIVPAIGNESKTGFIAPIEGELEKSFGLNYNPALQRKRCVTVW